MRILILTQWFEPEPMFKGIGFAQELVKLGHDVEVITGFPNYPGGKLYPGYKLKMIQREVIEGIPVLRVPLYPSHNSSAMGRVMNYTSFAFSAALLGVFLIKRADLAYVYHAPATIALPAIIYKYFRGIPFVYDINDLWPDTLVATNMVNNKILLKCLDLWCHVTYRVASHIVVGTPGFKRKLLERGVSEDKVSIIYNWCEEKRVMTHKRSGLTNVEPQLVDRFNVVFAGTMGKAQALDAVLDAAKRVHFRFPKVQFIFIGGGIDVDRLKEKKKKMGLSNVLFMPRRSVSEIGAILCMADVLLVHLKDESLFEITLPSKTQAYMAVGRPILMAVRGDAASLVERANAGIVCQPEDAASIQTAIEKLVQLPQSELDKMGECGSNYYWQELSLEIGALRFDRIFKSVARLPN